jgi:hypothetical protein
VSIKIDFSVVKRQRQDIEMCVLAFGHVEGSREFFMPSGDMATDAFERELAAAWNRLTPKQQDAILLGQFHMRVPTFREVRADGDKGKVLP